MFTRVKKSSEIQAMREGGRMLAAILELLDKKISVGDTTKEAAKLAEQELKAFGAESAFLGYQGYPDVLCVSVNDEVVHGIPSDNTVIAEGDIVSFDFGVRYKGLITDAAFTKQFGSGTSDTLRLIKSTKEALDFGISVIRSGTHVGDIGAAVEARLRKAKLGIVRDLTGHGVGEYLHEDPAILNYGERGTGVELLAGMTIAVEPMAMLGSEQVVLDSDGWTIRTADGSLAAHFEHTVLITEEGAEVLTAYDIVQ